MKARDERVALMNEILGAIRMLKVLTIPSTRFIKLMFSQFMAWERNFEKRVMGVREKELKFQRLNYIIEVRFSDVKCS